MDRGWILRKHPNCGESIFQKVGIYEPILTPSKLLGGFDDC